MILKDKKSSLLSRIAKYSFVFLIAFALITPVLADGEPCTGVDKSGTPTPYGCDPDIKADSSNTHPKADSGNTIPKADSGNTTSGVNITTGIKNPLGNSFSDIPSFIKGILDFVLLLGIPIVALAIIYCGFLFVTASGNSEKLKHAKQALLYTLVGAALLLGCLVITEAIKGTVDEIKTVDKAQNAK